MATITTINGTDHPKDSRAVINTNFSNLNTDKSKVFSGAYAGLASVTGHASGDIYLFTDSVYTMARYNGSSWDHFFKGRQVTPPVSEDFAWVNQGTSTLDTSSGSVYLTGPMLNSESLRIRKKALGTLPITYTMGFLFAALGGNDSTAAGMLLRESTTGKIITSNFAAYISSTWIASLAHASETGGRSGIAYYSGYAVVQDAFWIRMTVDSSNRTMYFSADGIHWHQWHQTTKDANFTTAPDEIGFYVNPVNGGYDVGINLFHWAES